MASLFILMLSLFIITVPCFSVFGETAEKIDEDKVIEDISEFDGKKIGVMSGSIYVDKVYDYIKNPDVYYYKSLSDAVIAAQSGKIDAVMGGMAILGYYTSKVDGTICKIVDRAGDNFGIISGKNEKGRKLIGEFNEFLAFLEQKGELDSLREKWFGDNDDVRKMDDFSSLPDKNGTLVIGTDPLFPPLEYLDNNRVIGYEIELVSLFCKERGYKPDIRKADFDGIIAGVSAGKFDIGASSYSITEERKKSVYFTDTTYVNHVGLVYRDDSAAAGGNIFEKAAAGFKKTFVEEDRWRAFTSGITVTLEITVLSILFGTLLGFIVHIICRKGRKISNRISAFARWVVQGMPEVVMLMIAYYIIFGKSSLSGVAVAVIVFSVIFACSMHNLLEAGEKGLDPGQKRAAVAMGYSELQLFVKIILPQVARGFIPAYLNSMTSLLKGTAVVGYIAVMDITKVGDIIRGTTYEAFFPLIAIALLYFITDALLRFAVKIATARLNFEKRGKETILKGAVIR